MQEKQEIWLLTLGVNIDENREIYCNNWALDILFDLIKADMVEKDG